MNKITLIVVSSLTIALGVTLFVTTRPAEKKLTKLQMLELQQIDVEETARNSDPDVVWNRTVKEAQKELGTGKEFEDWINKKRDEKFRRDHNGMGFEEWFHKMEAARKQNEKGLARLKAEGKL